MAIPIHQLYGNMFGIFVGLHEDALGMSASLRDGSIHAVDVEKSIHRQLDKQQSKLTMLWHQSNAAKTIVFSDFELPAGSGEDVAVIEARLRSPRWKILHTGQTLVDKEAEYDRDRPLLTTLFQEIRKNPALNVGAELLAIRTAMEAARDAVALAVPPVIGDIDYFARVAAPGNLVDTKAKTLAETGASGVASADAIDLLATAIEVIIPVP